MNRLKTVSILTAALTALGACQVFEDPSPEQISIQLSGSNGTQVMAIYSQIFTAGVDEAGVTLVQVADADTVFQVLPIDTIVDIAASRQMFLQVETMPNDTVDVDVQIRIDSRSVLSRSGLIFPGIPWRYVYQFNRPLTQFVEVVL
ncbi:MAG: hypothetical protein OEN56_03545 [Gemmatimonadota bacterium]|nr:hypothetical protein [Gemmatimonadota bacterium]